MKLAVALLCVTLLAFVARADDDTSDPFEATIREGLREYGNGRWAEARLLFAHAHGERPSARTLRGLGMVDFNLGRYARAASELEAALASDVMPLSHQLREHVDDLLWRSNRFVSHLRIQSRPSTAVLTIDGQTPSLDQRGDVILELGPHLLRANAAGYEMLERTLQIELPVASAVVLTLHARHEATAPIAPESSRLRTWAWSFTAAAPALFAVGAATWISAESLYRDAQQQCRIDACAHHVEGGQRITRLDNASHAAWAIGAALAATALVLWTLEHRERRSTFARAAKTSRTLSMRE